MMQPKISKNRISRKAASFTESVIREMTREALKYGATNSRVRYLLGTCQFHTAKKPADWRSASVWSSDTAAVSGSNPVRQSLSRRTMPALRRRLQRRSRGFTGDAREQA